MSKLTPEVLKQLVLDAGFEVYRLEGQVVSIAERVRVHLMDSGVSVSLESGLSVGLTVRVQRSDYPSTQAEQLFAKVREAVSETVAARGFEEVATRTRQVTDPVDAEHVLDVWHEVTYAKAVEDEAAMIEDLRWALQQPKCVS